MGDLIDRIKEFVGRNPPSHWYPPADDVAVAGAEAALCFALPSLLKECYTKIANGGFGPGYGVLGVNGGFAGDYGDIVSTYRQLSTDFASLGRRWDKDLLPFCAWGCAMLTCVKCDSSLRISTFDSGSLHPQQYGLAQFFEMWVAGVDILKADPDVYESESTMKNPFTGAPWKTKALRRKK